MYYTRVGHHCNDDHGKAVVHGEDVDEPDECQKSECVANAKAWSKPTVLYIALNFSNSRNQLWIVLKMSNSGIIELNSAYSDYFKLYWICLTAVPRDCLGFVKQ